MLSCPASCRLLNPTLNCLLLASTVGLLTPQTLHCLVVLSNEAGR